jgi:transcriptional regulator with XRE-family HTH domain
VAKDKRERAVAPKPAPEHVEMLKRAREQLGMTAADLAKAAGVVYETVWRLESGEGSIKSASHIREVLNQRGANIPSFFTTGAAVAETTNRSASPLQRNLMRFRSESGLSLQDAADAAGIDATVLLAYEDGKSELSGSHLLRLAEVYEREPAHFELEHPPPRKHRPAPAVHARIVGSIDDFTPENRAKLLELQREALAINSAERKRLEDTATKAKETAASAKRPKRA